MDYLGLQRYYLELIVGYLGPYWIIWIHQITLKYPAYLDYSMIQMDYLGLELAFLGSQLDYSGYSELHVDYLGLLGITWITLNYPGY